MTKYHMHARLMIGDLSDPDPDSCYEFQSRDSDNLAEVKEVAKQLAEEGFTVVIYDHGHTTALPGASDYRQIFKYWPDGQVNRN
jgi:hypothetical protein